MQGSVYEQGVEIFSMPLESSDDLIEEEKLAAAEADIDLVPSAKATVASDILVEQNAVARGEQLALKEAEGRILSPQEQSSLPSEGGAAKCPAAFKPNVAIEGKCQVAEKEEQMSADDARTGKQEEPGQLEKVEVDTPMSLDSFNQSSIENKERDGVLEKQSLALSKLHQDVGMPQPAGGRASSDMEKGKQIAEVAFSSSSDAQSLANLETAGDNVATAGGKPEVEEDEEESSEANSSSEESDSSDSDEESEEQPEVEGELETMYDSDFHESSSGSSSTSSSESESEEDYVEEEDAQDGVAEGYTRGAPPVTYPLLPPVPKVDLQLQPRQLLLTVGSISAIMGDVLIVQSSGAQRVLDVGSVLWLRDERSPLGLVDDLFGPVAHPFYSVRFNSADEIPAGAVVGCKVGYTAAHANFVLNDASLHRKGCDASGVNDEELPEDEIEFSDDEEEAAAKKVLRKKRSQPKKDHERSLDGGQQPERTPQEQGRGAGRIGSRSRGRGRGGGRSWSGHAPDNMHHRNPDHHRPNGRDAISAQMQDMHFRGLDARHAHPMEPYHGGEHPHPPQWQPPPPHHLPPTAPPHPHFIIQPSPPLPPGPHPHDMARGPNHPPPPPHHHMQHPFGVETPPAPNPWPVPHPEQTMPPPFVSQPPPPFLQAGVPPHGMHPHEPMMQGSAAHAHPQIPPQNAPMMHGNAPPHAHLQVPPGMSVASGPPPGHGPWPPPHGPPLPPLPGHVRPPDVAVHFGEIRPRPHW